MIEIVAWVGVSQALFGAFLVFTRKGQTAPDLILLIWLSLLALDFLTCALDYEIFNQPLLSSSFLLFNPALYLYIHSLTDPEFRLKPVHIFHLIPYLVFKVLAYIIQEPFSMDSFFVQDKNFLYRILFGASTVISCFTYNILSLVKVHRHRVRLQDERSNIGEPENLGWVLFLSVFYTIYCILAIIIGMLSYFNGMNPLTVHIYNYFVLLFLTYVLSFYGLYQINLTFKPDLVNMVRTPYQNSTMTEETKKLIREKIETYVTGSKSYLDPEMSMDTLSEKLGIPKYQLTEVLNTVIGKNFFQYINYHRVEEVKRRLSDKNNPYSIEAIGFDCGFASKSSFYTVFKNQTGMTPAMFRDSLQKA